MPVFESESIQHVALHRVGNKATDEGFILSKHALHLTDQLQDLLVRYFISPFKVEEYYHLIGDEDSIESNKVFDSCQSIFADPDCFLEESRRLASHLYNQSTHANIKGGDFFVVYFSRCVLDGEEMSAIGLFKSENKESFLKVLHGDEEWSRQEGENNAESDYHLEVHQGININKLDKGALIFNTEEENGYVVSVVDATNRTMDALYWKDSFLHIQQRQDDYYQTHQVMKVYKDFVTKRFPDEFDDVTKADQAELLNKSASFFKQNESFDMEDFTRDVLEQPAVIDSFQQFRSDYEKEHDVKIEDQFDINDSAVKKQARAYKSVIKLDKNFHIYVHGDSKMIEQGEDEKGKFYKVYYKEES